MPRRKLVATLTGLGGCVAIAWSIHGLMLIGNCGGDDAPPCPPESTPYFIGITAGIIATIFASIAGGGGGGAFIGLFPAIAIGALWAAFELPSEERAGPLLIGGIFVAVVLAPLLFVPFALARKRRALRLVTEGAAAIGTVTDISDTGVTINKNPRVKMKLRIESQDGSSTFDGEKTITASRLELPYCGQRFPVWFDPADRSRFVVGTKVDDSAAPEVRRLFALARAGDPGRADWGEGAKPDPLDRLAKLNELRLAGALTEVEFEEQKRRILDMQ